MKRVMKQIFKQIIATGLLIALVFVDPMIAEAKYTGTASEFAEVVVMLREAALMREKKVVIDYTGDESWIDSYVHDDKDYLYGGYLGFEKLFYLGLAYLDDPTTSDDADYLAGLIKYSSDDFCVDYDDGQFVFNLDYFETLNQTKYVNKHVESILDKLGVAYMNNYNKVKTIHDYVCRLITYKLSNKNYVSTMYGALKYRKALCNAYSLCMYKLCVEAGIPCKYVGGYAWTNNEYGGHAWNLVALGDKWYFVDATWDDEGKKITRKYFLRGTEDFDLSDPKCSHFMEKPYYEKAFQKRFPIARKRFRKGIDSDENKLITIGVKGQNSGKPDKKVVYKKSDIVAGFSHYKKRFVVKKNQMLDLQVFLKNKKAAALVSNVDFKFTKGSNRVKKLQNYGIYHNKKEKSWFTDLEVKYNKKGKVAVKISFLLVNGQKMHFKFNGRVK